jgi:tripartite motif-containing protein 37
MIHPSMDREQIVSREYCSDFEIGECWGYNRFYRIEGIIDEGFLHEEDGAIHLKFNVRASSYAQHSKD